MFGWVGGASRGIGTNYIKRARDSHHSIALKAHYERVYNTNLSSLPRT